MVAQNSGLSELPPLTVGPENNSSVTTAPPADIEAPIRSRLLRMADGYRAGRQLHQAEEMYFELATNHGDTLQGQLARQRLLDMCEEYERAGKLHQARAIYEQLL